MINFVFDNLEEGTNCVKQAGLNKGGSNRFTSAPIMNRMYLSQNENSDFSDFFIQNHIDTIDEKKLTNYIIPIGVNNRHTIEEENYQNTRITQVYLIFI